MSDSPYVPFFTSDFLGGTSGMTAATKGVYITLLCLMYEAEGPLNQNWETLARRCGSTLPAFKKAISILEDDDKISVSDEGLWSKKCDKHLAHRRDRQNSAKAAAKKRWQKSKRKQREGYANALNPQCHPEPEPEYSVTNVTAPVDFTKEVFDRGVAFLSKYGTPEQRARALIGKWRKEAGETETFNALRDANREGVTDPVGWITARLKPSTQRSVSEIMNSINLEGLQ